MAAQPGAPATSVEVAFDNQCEELLLKAIRDSRKEIKIAIFTFAKKSFADALIAQARRSVKISIKIDAHEAEFEFTQMLIKNMEQAKISVKRIVMRAPARMHHKFAVIDGQRVLTGSFNWTRQANDENRENLVLIESPALALKYLEEWETIKSAE